MKLMLLADVRRMPGDLPWSTANGQRDWQMSQMGAHQETASQGKRGICFWQTMVIICTFRGML